MILRKNNSIESIHTGLMLSGYVHPQHKVGL
jgi:hypothetical protein